MTAASACDNLREDHREMEVYLDRSGRHHRARFLRL
jgi:hypothetical protein